MINIFELFIDRVAGFDELANAVSCALATSADSVVSDDEYWSSDEEERPRLIGIEVSVSDGNFPTFVVGHCAADVYGEALGSLAKSVSVELQARVVVGDFINDVEFATGRLIVYFPDGARKFGYEKGGGGSFDVMLLPD